MFDSTTRRRLLAGSAATVCGLALGTTPVAADTVTVPDDYPTIQAAVDAAGADPTITEVVVTAGTYTGTLTIDVEDLVVRTSSPGVATVTDADALTGAAVSITADGVRFEGFEVTNPGKLLGISVAPGVDDVAVVDNLVRDVGPTGVLGVTGVAVGRGAHEGIEVRENTIRDLDQEIRANSTGFPTVNGILFDANNAAPATITDVTIDVNEIRNLQSDVAPLGIVLQQVTDGVSVNNNVVTDLLAAYDTDSEDDDAVGEFDTFAQGINVTSPTTADTDVAHNLVADVTSEDGFVAEAVKVDGDAAGLTVRANSLLAPIGANNADTDTLDAKNNWWGSRDGPEVAASNLDADTGDDRRDVVGPVTFDPFLRREPRGRGNGGSPPGGSPGGGPPGGGPP